MMTLDKYLEPMKEIQNTPIGSVKLNRSDFDIHRIQEIEGNKYAVITIPKVNEWLGWKAYYFIDCLSKVVYCKPKCPNTPLTRCVFYVSPYIYLY